MHSTEVRRRAQALVDAGSSLNSVSKQLGVSRAALRDWRAGGWSEAGGARTTCFRCQPAPTGPPDEGAYAHLLGLYLGDGCISALARGVHRLRIACCDGLPRPHGRV